MTDVAPEQSLAISDEAKRLLGDTLFNAVLNTILKAYIQDLMRTAPGSADGMVAHAGINAIDNIKGQLRALENDGVLIRKKMMGNTERPV